MNNLIIGIAGGSYGFSYVTAYRCTGNTCC